MLCGAQGGDKKGSQRESREEYKEMRGKAERKVVRVKEKSMSSCMKGWTPRREKRTCTDWLDRH